MRDGVAHVHVHVLPRRPGDFEPNDAIYSHLEHRAPPAAEADRRDRTLLEMADEAAFLAAFVPPADA